MNFDKYQNLCILKFLDPIQNGVLLATDKMVNHVIVKAMYLPVLQICPFLSEKNFRFNVKLETPQAFLILPALRYKQNRGDKDVRFISS